MLCPRGASCSTSFAISGSFPTAAEGEYQRSMEDYVIFPAGLLRGALYGLGIQAVVEPILGPEAHACMFPLAPWKTIYCVDECYSKVLFM